MTLKSLAERARALIRKRGMRGAVQRIGVVAYRRLMRWRIPRHPFDLKHGVETGGLLYARRIRSGHINDSQSTAYFGSQPSVVHAALRQWIAEVRETAHRLQRFTFVDVGCGKGRVLMLASEFPFEQIIGFDLSPQMTVRARENLKHWLSSPRRCQEITAVQGDVLEVPLPGGPLLLYMYHPFEAELFDRWVVRMGELLPLRIAPVYLLYVNPCHDEQLHTLSSACLLWTGDVAFTAEEAAAHLFGGISEKVSLYRLTPPGL